MTITFGNNGLEIGENFVGCVAGKYKTMGTIKTNVFDWAGREKEYNFVSTFMPHITAKIIDKNIKNFGYSFSGINGAY